MTTRDEADRVFEHSCLYAREMVVSVCIGQATDQLIKLADDASPMLACYILAKKIAETVKAHTGADAVGFLVGDLDTGILDVDQAPPGLVLVGRLVATSGNEDFCTAASLWGASTDDAKIDAMWALARTAAKLMGEVPA